jgi:hypothetical protein
LHGLGSLVWCFAKFIEVGDGSLNEWAFFDGCFGVIDGCGFEGLEMAFGVEELFAEGGEFVAWVAFDFGEFSVDDFEGLGFSGDVWVLGLELGDESF